MKPHFCECSQVRRGPLPFNALPITSDNEGKINMRTTLNVEGDAPRYEQVHGLSWVGMGAKGGPLG